KFVPSEAPDGVHGVHGAPERADAALRPAWWQCAAVVCADRAGVPPALRGRAAGLALRDPFSRFGDPPAQVGGLDDFGLTAVAEDVSDQPVRFGDGVADDERAVLLKLT